MTILEHPSAQALLDEAVLTQEQILELSQRLKPFLERYFPSFQRVEQCHNAELILKGKLSALSRKTCEPIAHFFGVRREVRARPLRTTSGNFTASASMETFWNWGSCSPGACPPYSIPPSGEAALNYRGLPYDILEDLLPQSGAWRQVAPLLLPREDVATGRPITPLHGGHVGLLCTAGLLNGVFGDGENRHIARWRSVKHVTTFVEEDGDAQIIHHRERWTNELRLVYADGRTLKLTETPAKKEDDGNGECTPSTRAA